MYTYEGVKFRIILLKPCSSGSNGMMYSSTFSSDCAGCGEILSSDPRDGEAIVSFPSVTSLFGCAVGGSMIHEVEQSFREVEPSKDIRRC